MGVFPGNVLVLFHKLQKILLDDHFDVLFVEVVKEFLDIFPGILLVKLSVYSYFHSGIPAKAGIF
jgi:hypothetical protein